MTTRDEAGSEGEEEIGQEDLLGYLLEALAAGLDPRELRKHGEAARRELALYALSLFESFQPGEIKVRVSNPGGYRAGRTVLELLVADQPFLVDTFLITIRRLGLRRILLLHPVVSIERNFDGSIARIGKSAVDGRESYLYLEVPLISDKVRRASVESELQDVFTRLGNVVADHGRMVKALRKHTAEIEFCARQIRGGLERARELSSFLDWLADDNFVFLGYHYDHVSRTSDSWRIELDRSSGLGLLREVDPSRPAEPLSGELIPAEIRSRLADERLIFFDKSRSESTIHRRGRLDCVSIKVLDEAARVTGFGRFIGLLTHKAIRARGSEIPILSRRRERVLQSLGAAPGSHSYKAAIEAFDSLPIEFLFPFDLEDVTRAVQRIVLALENPRVEVYVVPDPLNRSFFVSVILPRPLYDEDLRRDLRKLLTDRYAVSYVDNRTSFLDDEIALIHFFCSSGDDVDLDQLADLESDIKDRATGWENRFEMALLKRHPAERAYQLANEYGKAFPQEYRVVTAPHDAVTDVDKLEQLRGSGSQVEIGLQTDAEAASESRIKIYQSERPYLTDRLPVLDKFGLRVIDATLTQAGCDPEEPLWIVTFRMEPLPADPLASGDLQQRVLEGLRVTLCHRVENDSLNRLILGAGLTWHEVELVRAYLAYARQLGGAPEGRFAARVLLKYPMATRALISLFRARFDPSIAQDRILAEENALAGLTCEREHIGTSDEDRIFDLVANLIRSSVRTNFFAIQPDRLEALAFKLNSKQIKGMPEPRPHAEIFMHSAEMDAVHLRGGLVSRGGIRWSDRLQDLRAEILGLMKTQMTKNGLIVPAGAKGGFVLKRRFSDAVAARKEADRQYARFMKTLLGMTDNITAGGVVPPEGVVCHDGDDPYLVVAADKGTAHLSDVANRIAEEAGFWLGDAFASGGSDGYDHKREGITARGAWVCVKRHFLELDLDIESESFSIVGIGDMSGDVFGNGLLLARRAKLLAAFNHLHIFLDPDPDPEVAWPERERLFKLPGSSWREYDAEKVSAGGGIFDRAARAIPLTPEVKEMLAVDQGVLSGEELVRAILRMRVDLLWNGGIGTYVKATSESDADVGDRSNAAVRIDASELRARVIGEGGNLGLTQLARVEYALSGGRINTDAIDNSGGVDLSDHEVNFKILLAPRCKSGQMSRDERNAALRACVGEAGAAVLAHNTAQARCLSMDLLRSRRDPERMALVAEFLEEYAELDPALEFLPEREELRARSSLPGAPTGYTRPELAILLGYTKLLSERELEGSELLDHVSLQALFVGYFPASLRGVCGADVEAHRLRPEITATCLTNWVIDRAGITLVPELVRAAGSSVGQILLASYIVDQLLEADQLRSALEAQSVPEALRLQAMLRIEEAVREGTCAHLALARGRWPDREEFAEWSERLKALRGLKGQATETKEVGPQTLGDAALEARLEPGLACAIDQLPDVARSLGAIVLAADRKLSLAPTVELHASIGALTRISWLLNRLRDMDRGDGWDRIASEALHIEMLEAQLTLTKAVLGDDSESDELEAFTESHAGALCQIERTVHEIEARERGGLAPLAVLSQQIRRLC